MEKSSGRASFHAVAKMIRRICSVFSYLPVWLVKLLLFPFLNMTGKLGSAARYIFAARRLESIGDAVYIAPFIILKSTENISIGDNCSLHEFCYLDGAGGISIGNNVSIAHNCSILSTNHGWADKSIPIKYNPSDMAAVCIHDDVWIGCGVRILAGVEIKSRCIIAAGAVVTKSLDAGGIYAGVPAKKIGDA